MSDGMMIVNEMEAVGICKDQSSSSQFYLEDKYRCMTLQTDDEGERQHYPVSFVENIQKSIKNINKV